MTALDELKVATANPPPGWALQKYDPWSKRPRPAPVGLVVTLMALWALALGSVTVFSFWVSRAAHVSLQHPLNSDGGGQMFALVLGVVLNTLLMVMTVGVFLSTRDRGRRSREIRTILAGCVAAVWFGAIVLFVYAINIEGCFRQCGPF